MWFGIGKHVHTNTRTCREVIQKKKLQHIKHIHFLHVFTPATTHSKARNTRHKEFCQTGRDRFRSAARSSTRCSALKDTDTAHSMRKLEVQVRQVQLVRRGNGPNRSGRFISSGFVAVCAFFCCFFANNTRHTAGESKPLSISSPCHIPPKITPNPIPMVCN